MRLTQDILDDDEALADWCEAYGPSPDSETPVAEHFLRCAVEDHAGEQQIAQCVAAALAEGASWSRVAEILGVPVEEAKRRFARAGESARPTQPH